MKVVTVHSNKGGVGKSTTARILAVAAMLDKKRACIIDLQEQCLRWADRRNNAEPRVVAATPGRLNTILDTERKAKTQLVIIDTVPVNEADALKAMKLSDVTLIPTSERDGDIQGIGDCIETVSLSGRPAYTYFCRVKAVAEPQTRLTNALTVAAEFGLPICPVVTYDRTAHEDAYTLAQTAQEADAKSQAAEEIAQLYTWLKAEIKL